MQSAVPERYRSMTDEDVDEAIQSAREKLAAELVILGHHYQQDRVLKFADHRGDSLQLAELAADQPDARYVVFLGVHFMAETADILTEDHQSVILPHLEAGCPMADMATAEEVRRCWDYLSDHLDGDLIPVTYVNSSAEIKAFCGARGGACCTSSSAKQVMAWALEKGDAVLFLPDQHLGRNTGEALGVRGDEMALWRRADASLVSESDRPRLILWDGYCPVHAEFTTDMTTSVRRRHPDVRIVVHPECCRDVVQRSDEEGSTEFIRRMVSEAAPGSAWAVGTEEKLVARLALEHPDRTVVSLSDAGSVCVDMDLITPRHLLWVLDELLEGRAINRIEVPTEIARDGRLALNRMFDLFRRRST